MIRAIRILWHRQSIKNATGMLAAATSQERSVLLRDIAVSKLRLSQLEG
ncbi:MULTISPECIES: hypothetical protein [Pseudomonadota]